MKTAAICYILVAIGIAIAITFVLTDPKQSLNSLAEGSHSHLLRHELSFSPGSQHADAVFIATLTNTANRTLEVMVEDRGFHGAFEIVNGDGEKLEAYPASYYRKLMTSMWSDPTHSLSPGASLTWRIPVYTLVVTDDGDQRSITAGDLDGAAAISRMEGVAVVPALKEYISSNAMQRSNRISLPRKGEQAEAGDTIPR